MGGGKMCQALPSAATRVAFAQVAVVVAFASVVHGPYLKDLGLVGRSCQDVGLGQAVPSKTFYN